MGDVANILAYHYGQSDQTAKAAQYNAMAGIRSLGTYSLEEAERYLQKALALLRCKDPSRLDSEVVRIIAALAVVLWGRSKPKEVVALLERDLDRLWDRGDPEEISMVRYFYVISLLAKCRFSEAASVSDEALRTAQASRNGRAIIYASASAIWDSLHSKPMPLREFEHTAKAALAEAERSHDSLAVSILMFSIAWSYFLRGLTGAARHWAVRLLGFTRERDPRLVAVAHYICGWLDILGRNYESAAREGEQCRRTAITPVDRLSGLQLSASAKVLSGRVMEGIAEIEKVRSISLESDWPFMLLATDLAFGVGLLLNGEFNKGVRWLERAICLCDKRYRNRPYADFTRISLAECYIELLRGNRRRVPAVPARNILFLARLRLGAKRRAEVLLRTALQNELFSHNGIFAARIHLGLGTLDALSGRRQLASLHLAHARSAALAQGEHVWLAKIDEISTSLEGGARRQEAA
ncbi:MAG: hypothetical protein JOY71_30870 [Acetobacteraceae bacterium]|nr:hypothetical protein [Acetobacteraceae bacterium]